MNRVRLEGGIVSFRCPGCRHYHSLPVEASADRPNRPVWGFNGNLQAPTLTPSILATGGCYVDPAHCQGDGTEWCDRDKPADEDGMKVCQRCHSFVTDGRIEFLGDSTHALAGQTVELPSIE